MIYFNLILGLIQLILIYYVYILFKSIRKLSNKFKPFCEVGIDSTLGRDKTSMARFSDNGDSVEFFEYDDQAHAEWERKLEEEKKLALQNLGYEEDEL